MPISLTAFVARHNLPKTTAFRYCQQLNIAVANGLTDEDCERLLEKFGVSRPSSKSGAIILRPPGAIDVPGANSAPTVSGDLSSVTAAMEQAAALAAHSTTELQGFLNQYAHYRVAGAIAKIDAQVAAMESTALNSAVGKLAGGNAA